MMQLGRRRALGMVIVVLLWTAAPLMACVQGLGANSKLDCCATMAMPDCGSDSMVSGSCCQLAPTPTSGLVVPGSMLEQSREVGQPVWNACLQLTSDFEVAQQTYGELPPDPPPGGLSVLRI